MTYSWQPLMPHGTISSDLQYYFLERPLIPMKELLCLYAPSHLYIKRQSKYIINKMFVISIDMLYITIIHCSIRSPQNSLQTYPTSYTTHRVHLFSFSVLSYLGVIYGNTSQGYYFSLGKINNLKKPKTSLCELSLLKYSRVGDASE